MIESRHRNDLQSDVEALRRDLQAVRKDFAELTKDLVDAGQSSVRDLNERVQSEVKHRVHQAEEAGEQAVAAARHSIEHRPLLSVASAFGVGLLLGVLVHRARS